MTNPLQLIAALERSVADLAEIQPGKATADEVLAVVEAAEALRRSVGFAIETWRDHSVEALKREGRSLDMGNATATVAPKFRDRYDHGLIATKVVRAALRRVDPDGEIVWQAETPAEAAERAVALMMGLYVAPASKPKGSALIELGFETTHAAMASHEKVGEQVKVRAK